ncbi:uracil-DNA glycosylase [Paracoccus sp. S-4012]|uniref:uracil-DNA glycosylase n=1 Tax=Paracoccus sp. S-4012 TaxID=2665648 RepID=UPI0012B0C6F3|nr:uracil-DNA glycosylase [Paracoccus sp. S-4012]MRX50333.1 uracil-DNA glycosylase [Paracoccus sp. S-4012]
MQAGRAAVSQGDAPSRASAPIPPAAWAHLPFFHDTWPALSRRLAGEGAWLPGPARVFAAFEAVPPSAVRVVILGQDPYPTPGHADGLAFSVAPGIAPPRSLANIFAEMEADLGTRPRDGHLGHLARQGVLLLNTCLSVPAGAAGGHARLGWQPLAREAVAETQRHGPLAFVLWGAQAAKAVEGLPRAADFVAASPHPSPLSARRGFFGSRPFSRVNAWLAEHRPPAIDWTGA